VAQEALINVRPVGSPKRRTRGANGARQASSRYARKLESANALITCSDTTRATKVGSLASAGA